MSKQKRTRTFINYRALLIFVSLISLWALRFIFGAPVWLLLLLCLWMPIYFVAYPVILRKKWIQFEKDFSLKFQKQEYKQLLVFYKNQWFLRRFGPEAEMLGKLGLIYSALKRYRDAEQALERGVEAMKVGPHRERLYFNLANIKFELGKFDEAEQIYRTLKPASPYRHTAQTQLALIDIHRGRRTDIARGVLEQARKRASGALKARIDEALLKH